MMSFRSRRRWGAVLPLALAVATAIGAQATASSGSSASAVADPADEPADVPFSVGERSTYDVRFGVLHVGSGTMEVTGVQTLRGHDVWHTMFDIRGGTLFYHVNDTLESWFDKRTLSSMRFVQHLDEGGKVRSRNYEIYPDRSAFVLNNKPEEPSVPDPLDDGSFLYFVRTLPLEVGATYTFPRYFNPKANPVTIRVLRKEEIQVPAGKFKAIVVQPIIKSGGIFSQHGEAEVWFSDDSAHIMLQMKSKLSIGSLNLFLKSYQPGRGAAASVPGATATDVAEHSDTGSTPKASAPADTDSSAASIVPSAPAPPPPPAPSPRRS